IIESFIQTVWALVLLTPLWQSSTTNLNGSWTWVNSPWVFLAILIGIAAILLLQFSAAHEVQEKMRETEERSHHVHNVLINESNTMFYNARTTRKNERKCIKISSKKQCIKL